MPGINLPLIFLYGPPGSGKSAVGRALASALELSFRDLDAEIEGRAAKSIPEIFAARGESGFRQIEKEALAACLERGEGVLALGGGTLLDPENRSLVKAAGRVVCLAAPPQTLFERLNYHQDRPRPLLSEEGPIVKVERLEALLVARAGHYTSFARQINTAERSIPELAWEIQVNLGWFRVGGMGNGYDVRLWPGGLDFLGDVMRSHRLEGPITLVVDETPASFYAARVEESLRAKGYAVFLKRVLSGEVHKTMNTVAAIWDAFLTAKMERNSTVVALGGGVLTDLAGFAAATFLRGIPWVVIPTTLLAMVDASLGGKTGADLPQGKNLVGAFHPPQLVLADPQVLATLPQEELRAGLAEVVKAGLIADAQLFDLCAGGWGQVQSQWEEAVRRAMAVKVRVVQEDPYERGNRAKLNLGHTIGHALETASGFQMRHGEAVSIGMVVEAQLAESIGIAKPGLSQTIARTLNGLGLPTELPPGIDRQAIVEATGIDKKRSGGRVRFTLPERVCSVRVGIEIDNLEELLGRIL